MHELIRDITFCILFAWALGLSAHFFRQPLILAYLIAGCFIGPFGTGLVKSQESIRVISELGLIFMLFMIGLEIDLKTIVRAGRVILVAAPSTAPACSPPQRLKPAVQLELRRA